jgi:hypothetical protein
METILEYGLDNLPTFCEKRPPMAEWAYIRSQKFPAKAKTFATSFAKVCQQLIELYAIVP